MFLRRPLDLVPVSLLDEPQVETPSWTQKTTVTYTPAQSNALICSGEILDNS